MVMMMSEKKDIRPAFIKFGVALAFSLGGILYTILRNKKNKPARPPSTSPSPEHQSQVGRKSDADAKALQKTASLRHLESAAHLQKDEVGNVSIESIIRYSSPSKRSYGDKDTYLLPEFNDLVKDFDFVSSPQKEVESFVPNAATVSGSNERLEQELEIKRLRDMVSALTERERSLEIQLLEYYGLKEQQNTVMELQNRLKINTMEAKLFNLKIESLLADKKRLEDQVADHAKVASELEAAKAKIKLLRRKLRSEAEQNRERILALKDRVDKMQEQETKALSADLDIQLKLHKLKELEEEVKEPQESNEDLRKENDMLSGKLEYLQSIAIYYHDEETQGLSEESNELRIRNENLSREMEQLQAARCSDLEELVYLRWINACLRYELRNYQADPGTTSARDLSKSLSPKSEVKAKQLILEYANKEGVGDVSDFESGRWSSSQASNLTEDDSPLDVSVSSTSKPTKNKLFGKLMRLLRGKGKSGELRRNSSLDMNAPPEDSASQCSSGVTGVSPATFHTRSRNSSHNSSRRSLDLSRLPFLQAHHVLNESSAMPQRNSHDGSSSLVFKVMNVGQGSKEDAEKSELVKYADALRDSRRRTPSIRKRSASVSSF